MSWFSRSLLVSGMLHLLVFIFPFSMAGTDSSDEKGAALEINLVHVQKNEKKQAVTRSKPRRKIRPTRQTAADYAKPAGLSQTAEVTKEAVLQPSQAKVDPEIEPSPEPLLSESVSQKREKKKGIFLSQPPKLVRAKKHSRVTVSGDVTVKVEVLETGEVGRVVLLESSGLTFLDKIALNDVKNHFEFEPKRLNNRPIVSWVELPIKYRPI